MPSPKKKPARKKPNKPELAKPAIEIINGTHFGSAIGYLTDPDGKYVPIYSDSATDLVDAMTRAIGPLPSPPEFGVGGALRPITNEKGFVTSYTYDPAGDELNKAKAAAYSERVKAWNARAAAIQDAVKQILSGKGK
jgi:hypothetical protein